MIYQKPAKQNGGIDYLKVAAGDPGEIKLLYRLVTGFLRTRVPWDPELIEEIAQESVVKIATRINQYKPLPEKNFSSWCITITQNTLKDETALNSRRTRLLEKIASSGDYDSDNGSKEDFPENRRLAESLDPNEYQELFLHVRGLGYKEISKVLKKPMGTVSVRIHRQTINARNYLNSNSS